ncbi:MAG: glycosyltransferase family 4 protein [Planctomycetota bacterium]
MSSNRSPRSGLAICIASGEEGGGIARVLKTLADALPRRGWHVEILCLGRGDGRLANEVGRGAAVGLGLVPPGNFAGGPVNKIVRFAKVRRFATRHADEIASRAKQMISEWRAAGGDGPVVLETVSPHLLPVVGKAAEKLGVTVVWDMPNTVGNLGGLGINQWLYKSMCRRHAVLPLANSGHTAASFGDSEPAAHVVQPMTDERRFDPAKLPEDVRTRARDKLGLPADARVLGMLARLTHDKGPHRLIDAAAAYNRNSDRPFHVLLVGDGPAEYLDDLRRRAKADGVDGSVHVGEGTRHVEELLPACDIGVNARMTAEPFGLSVVEAMMMNIPVLAHAFGGPAETVVDGVTGWHVLQADDDEALTRGLTAALQRVVNDEPRWPQMGRDARARALKCFSTRALTDRWIELASRHAAKHA